VLHAELIPSGAGKTESDTVDKRDSNRDTSSKRDSKRVSWRESGQESKHEETTKDDVVRMGKEPSF